jgi:hypothetical protein
MDSDNCQEISIPCTRKKLKINLKCCVEESGRRMDKNWIEGLSSQLKTTRTSYVYLTSTVSI